MMDLHNQIKVVRCVDPVASGTTGTGQVGKVVDRAGYESVEFVIGYGAITATAATLSVIMKEGDVTGTMTSVADAFLLGTELAAGVAAAVRVDGSTEKIVTRIGYAGSKRYVQVDIDAVTTAAVIVSAIAVLGSPHKMPVS